MFRHPHYLAVPWDVHGHHETTESHRHLWWVIATLGPVRHVFDRRGGHEWAHLARIIHDGSWRNRCPQTGTGAKKKGASPQQYERVRGASPPQGKRRVPGQSSCLGTLRAGE
jgi:hypothetical protein